MNIEEKAKVIVDKVSEYLPEDLQVWLWQDIESFAKQERNNLVDRYEKQIQSKVPELRELVNK